MPQIVNFKESDWKISQNLGLGNQSINFLSSAYHIPRTIPKVLRTPRTLPMLFFRNGCHRYKHLIDGNKKDTSFEMIWEHMDITISEWKNSFCKSVLHHFQARWFKANRKGLWMFPVVDEFESGWEQRITFKRLIQSKPCDCLLHSNCPRRPFETSWFVALGRQNRPSGQVLNLSSGIQG